MNATAQEVHSRGHPRHSGLMRSRDVDPATFDAGLYDMQVDGEVVSVVNTADCSIIDILVPPIPITDASAGIREALPLHDASASLAVAQCEVW